MAIDETVPAKKVDELEVEVSEVEEQVEEKPDELGQEEEKPAASDLVNGLPFNLEEFEARITKKVQAQCREECQNFLNAYFKQSTASQSSNVIHGKIACTSCSVNPIVGIRY